ncbi:MAG: ATP-dependent helicase [Propionibacteriaceae bacterium]|nr:ATP-dependent helicase [Propionibacteriaceae bacterium]
MTDPESLLSGLDSAQAAVATAFGGPLAVVAGAGSGKTRAITHRIAYGVASGEFRAGEVLAVTFTTKAAAELRARLVYLGVPAVAARTFHSAALRQARFFWPQVFRSELPPVASDRLGLVAEAMARLRIPNEGQAASELLTEVSWAKVSNVLPQDYPELASAAHREVPGLDAELAGKVLQRYEQVKNARGVIDFDDILLCACALLAENPQVADEVRSTYQHLVVDEYQDVNPLERTLLGLWLGSDPQLCAVGDPLQTIHSFAGASSSYLSGFTAEFPGAEVLRLATDYRSSPQIAEFANRVAQQAGISSGMLLRSQAPPGPEPEVAGAVDEAAEAGIVAEWLREQHRELPWSALAVLFRTRAQADALALALEAAGVPFNVAAAPGPVAEPSAGPEDAVTLATLHSAKGLEWGGVAIAGVQEGTLPHPAAVTEAQLAEEARLFYVGVTRAKSRLLVTWSARRGPGSARRQPSRLLPIP